jgi:glutathione S-transferase
MAANASRSRAKLYVIMGSHACRAAILMLDHKRVAFDTIVLPSGMHPALVRLAGFNANGEGRAIDERPHRMLALADQLGTVPALRLDGQRVMANRRIARFLDDLSPEPPLFPLERARREQVEEVERWGDETFQMTARRTVLSATASRHLLGNGAEGRLGPLLFRHDLVRYGAARVFGVTFAATPDVEDHLLGEVQGMFDSIDGWIAEGLLNGEQLNAADFLIAPSLALLEYHRDLEHEIRARPLGLMLERILPLDA